MIVILLNVKKLQLYFIRPLLFYDWWLQVRNVKIKLFPTVDIDDIELKNVIQSNAHGEDNPGFEAEVRRFLENLPFANITNE